MGEEREDRTKEIPAAIASAILPVTCVPTAMLRELKSNPREANMNPITPWEPLTKFPMDVIAGLVKENNIPDIKTKLDVKYLLNHR